MLFDFPAFASDRLQGAAFSGPLWFLFLALAGASATADRFETNNLFRTSMEFNLAYVLGGLAGGALIGGFLNYLIHGGIYHLLVRLSGGRKGFGASANISLYALAPAHCFTLATFLLWLSIRGEDYFKAGIDPVLENLTLAITFALLGWGIVNRYRASRATQGVKKGRGIVFLIGVPTLFVLAVVGGVFWVATLVGDQISGPNDRGLEAYEYGNYETAIGYFEEALRKTPSGRWEDRMSILRNLALAHGALGESDKSRQYYQQAAEICPAGSIERVKLEGSLALLDNDIRSAIANFLSALQRNSDDFEAHNELGLIFLGEYDEGYTDYDKALFHNLKAHELSGDLITLSLLARTRYWRDEYEEAERLTKEWQAALPNDVNAPLFLGLIAHETDRPAEAVGYLEQVFAMDGSLREGYLLEIYEESRETVGR